MRGESWPAAAIYRQTVEFSHFLANNNSHRNLYGSAAFPGMIRLCIAEDQEFAALHSRGLDICPVSTVI